MQASELQRRIEANDAPVIVDSRSELEYRHGHIPGAISAPMWKIILNRAILPKEKQLHMVVHCGHGQRAWVARLFMSLRGYRSTEPLEGDMKEWKKAGRPLEK
jgi:rhodanese-related sulfurtransferase